MGNVYSMFFPPEPRFTEADLPQLSGKVFLVTGGYSGVGYELSSMLYRAGGHVYIAGRSEASAMNAIAEIQALPTTTPGELSFLKVALDDLNSVKPAAETFLRQESRLDVLFHNAGVSNPPAGSVGVQGHELQLATNSLGPYLLTRLLSPILISTAKTEPSASVRVVFTTSIATDLGAPIGGFDIALLSQPSTNQQVNYTTSKTVNYFFGSHFASELGPHGVLSVCQNPGNLKTALLRHMPKIVHYLVAPLLYSPRFGALTELFSGLSPDLLIEDGGAWIQPFGRLHPHLRPDLLAATKTVEEGGTGFVAEVIEWYEKNTADFR